MSGHRPRKRFGQHFLRDHSVVRNIVDAFSPRPGDIAVEIGPGEGVLTRELVERISPLHVVELDRDLVSRLRAEFPPQHVIVHAADALKFDFRSLAPANRRMRVIGNLPYNISTPLLFHLIEHIHCIDDMLFMLQKEVVDRLSAAPDTPDYGRLSVMIQWRLKVEPLFNVAPTAFYPPPQVDSTIVRLTPHAAPLIAVRDPHVFADIVRAAFANRRKMLRNNLKDMVASEQLMELGIDAQRRAETLTLAEFASIANSLATRR